VDFTLLKVRVLRLGLSQNSLGRSRRGINRLYQFVRVRVDDEGSKLENKLAIMINLGSWSLPCGSGGLRPTGVDP